MGKLKELPDAPLAPTAQPEKLAKFVIPEKMGDVADLMYNLKTEAARVKAALEASPLAKQLAEIESRRAQLDDYVIENMSKSAGSGAIGEAATAEVYTKKIPTVDVQNGGWDKFYGYVAKNKAFHLLSKSLSTRAIDELVEDGEKLPPGLIYFNQVKISLTKNTKKRGK